MCGISGYLTQREPILLDLLQEMNSVLRHRGPDYGAVWHEDSIGLTHRRLSILDLSEQGNQPMVSFDKRYVITYNGEVYNYLELKCDLQQKGYSFRSKSDTEVILNGFHHYGEGIFEKLNGIFAFAIWDRMKQQLFLVRDRYGVKPLYYYQGHGKFIFGSEIKSILIHQEVPRAVQKQALHEFLYYGTALGGRTLFEGIEKVKPGEIICIDTREKQSRNFWQINDLKVHYSVTEEEAIGETRKLLGEAVGRQLVSDVPVGVFLSGGIDSSAITAFASRHYAGRLSTFTATFDYEKVNELAKAQKIAHFFGTQHHELFIKGKDLPGIIEKLIEHHDEPFSDAANIPIYLLTKEVGNSYKVILQGDGGDELFAGYRRYATLSKINSLKPIFWLIRHFLPQLNLPSLSRLKRYATAVAQSDHGNRMALLLTEETTYDSPVKILSPRFKHFLHGTNPFLIYQHWNHLLMSLDPVQKMLWTDSQIILPEIFLEKVDKASMANGVEVRTPFLDNMLASYVQQLPSSTKIKNGQNKWLLRKALRGIIPDDILDGPKVGFGVPYAEWLKKPLKGYFLEATNSPFIKSLELFDEKVLTIKKEEHFQGKKNNGFLLWKLMNLCIWLEKFNVNTNG